MSEVSIQSAKASLDALEEHLIKLPQGTDRLNAERLRDNLATCLSLGASNPNAANILLPNVLTAAEEYLHSIQN